MADKLHLLSILRAHQGAQRGITADSLSNLLDALPRHVRQLITELREDGVAICGTPKTGYFIATTPEDIEQTCLFLRNRALHSLKLESKLRKMSLPELLGQMRLEAVA